MARTFSVESQTVPAADFNYVGNQAARAEKYNVERVFVWPRDLRGNELRLPNYVLNACRADGYEPHCIGGTTYSHSVIGLSRIA